MHSDRKLYLVFEYLDLDLKKHMDSHPNFGTNHQLVKVSAMMMRLLRFVLFAASGNAADSLCAMQYYLYQMLQGIAYCHSHRYIASIAVPP